MSDNPYLSLLYLGLAGYLFYLWRQDYQALAQGKEINKPFPGAYASPPRILFIALIGSLIIIGGETWGEIQLGISAEQNVLPWFALFSICAAAVIEEMMFRGFLADFTGVAKRPKVAGILICVSFSLLFALAHEHFWQWDDEGISFHFTAKACFSSSILVINSLWLYYLRFCRWNPQHSLLPCMLGHLSSNLLVYAIKWAQGFIAW